MRIAVTSMGANLDSQVDPRFGRCQYFIIVDPESMQFEAVQNPNIQAGSGAGIATAQMIAQKGVDTVLTGNVRYKSCDRSIWNSKASYRAVQEWSASGNSGSQCRSSLWYGSWHVSSWTWYGKRYGWRTWNGNGSWYGNGLSSSAFWTSPDGSCTGTLPKDVQKGGTFHT